MVGIETAVAEINSIVWGVPMLVLILGTGIWLTIRLHAMPWRSIGEAFGLLWHGRSNEGHGEISPFRALMTSLSATIGTGNIAGVGTAIALGGPGALFWMWCTALVGMATKYAEAVCAVHFREQDEEGHYSGGPMYYIRNGLHARWHWLAIAFAIMGSIAGFGIGNTVQANSVADVMQSSFGVPPLWTGVAMLLVVGAVILGGVQRIAQVAGVLVPFMALAYLAIGILVLLLNVTEIPAAVALIVLLGVATAGLGVLLSRVADLTLLEGYLATSPGGVYAVLATAVETGSNVTFIIAAQVVRILLMLFAAPLLARVVVWAGARFGRQSRAITDASKDPIRVAD